MNEDDEAWDPTITREDLNTPAYMHNSPRNPGDRLSSVKRLSNLSPDEDSLDVGGTSSGSLDRNLPAAAPAPRRSANNSSMYSLLKNGIIPGLEGLADYLETSPAHASTPIPIKNPNDPVLPELDCPLVLNESGPPLREINIIDVKSTMLAQSTKKEREKEANKDVTSGANSARMFILWLKHVLRLTSAAPLHSQC